MKIKLKFEQHGCVQIRQNDLHCSHKPKTILFERDIVPYKVDNGTLYDINGDNFFIFDLFPELLERNHFMEIQDYHYRFVGGYTEECHQTFIASLAGDFPLQIDDTRIQILPQDYYAQEEMKKVILRKKQYMEAICSLDTFVVELSEIRTYGARVALRRRITELTQVPISIGPESIQVGNCTPLTQSRSTATCIPSRYDIHTAHWQHNRYSDNPNRNELYDEASHIPIIILDEKIEKWLNRSDEGRLVKTASFEIESRYEHRITWLVKV